MKKKTKKKKVTVSDTYINFVLDETGSMSSCIEGTISGFNEYVESLKKTKGKVYFSLTQFDSKRFNVIHKVVPLKNVIKLSRDNYRPGDMTNLYDSIARTIKATEQDVPKKSKVLCVILTDGEENASTEYTKAKLNALVKQKEEDGWNFIYLGANQDSFKSAGNIGISAGNTINFQNTNIGTRSAYTLLAAQTVAYADTGRYGSKVKSFFDGKTEVEAK